MYIKMFEGARISRMMSFKKKIKSVETIVFFLVTFQIIIHSMVGYTGVPYTLSGIKVGLLLQLPLIAITYLIPVHKSMVASFATTAIYAGLLIWYDKAPGGHFSASILLGLFPMVAIYYILFLFGRIK